MPDAADNTTHIIRDLVRSGDRDRYWAALFAPDALRPDLLALYAFNLELSRIADQVREPQLGEIRLEWWRQSLAGAIAGEASGHPVIDALAAALLRHGLDAQAAEVMIEARSAELSPDPPPGLAALRDYLAGTAGAVFRLGAVMLGADAERATEASAHAGLAYGLTGIMLSLPHHAARGRVLLPADLLARHGLHANVILHGDDNADLRAALRDLAAMARAALDEARLAVAALPPAALPAFLPLTATGATLKALAAPGHHPLRDVAQLNPLRRFGLIWRAHLRGRV